LALLSEIQLIYAAVWRNYSPQLPVEGRLAITYSLYAGNDRLLRRNPTKEIEEEFYSPDPLWSEFWEIIGIAWQLEVFDPRDIVYAFLGHPSAQRNGVPVIQADYSKSAPEVFKEIAIESLVVGKNEEVLSTVQHTETPEPGLLPTWVPDLSRGAEATRFGSNYDTASDELIEVDISGDGNVIKVKGFIIDTIAERTRNLNWAALGKLDTEPEERDVKGYESWLEILELIKRADTPLRYPNMSTEMVTGLMVSADQYEENTEKYLLADFHAFCRYCDIVLPKNEAIGTELEHFDSGIGNHMRFQAYMDNCDNRVVFRTSTGYLGFGPSVMEIGDTLCILLGARVPFVLRKVEDHYILIGGCYVQGLMKGEVTKELLDAKTEPVEFEIH